jgi:regulator of RNase E activity RraA
VVIPAAQLEAATARALEIVAAEKRIIREMRQGQELADILHIPEKLKRKREAGLIPQLAKQ